MSITLLFAQAVSLILPHPVQHEQEVPGASHVDRERPDQPDRQRLISRAVATVSQAACMENELCVEARWLQVQAAWQGVGTIFTDSQRESLDAVV